MGRAWQVRKKTRVRRKRSLTRVPGGVRHAWLTPVPDRVEARAVTRGSFPLVRTALPEPLLVRSV
eukprot:scaffold48862_cov36-Phaeocystis_antarctica.AAC.2